MLRFSVARTTPGATGTCLIVDSYIHDPDPLLRLGTATDTAYGQHPAPVRGESTSTIKQQPGLRRLRQPEGFRERGDSRAGGNVGASVVVDNNLLAGGGYTVYCEQDGLGGNGGPCTSSDQ